MVSRSSFKRQLWACAVACGMCFTTNGLALAAECGCVAGCETCPNNSPPQCDCNRKSGFAFFNGKSCLSGKGCLKCSKHNCLSRALDAVAGSVEKLFRGGKRSGCACDDCAAERGCDDACDAAMIEELMMPVPTHEHDHPHSGHSHHDHSHHGSVEWHSAPLSELAVPTHDRPIGSVDDAGIAPAAPIDSDRSGHPMLDIDSTRSRRSDSQLPEPKRVPPPVRMPEPGERLNPHDAPGTPPRTDEGSIFDTLTDPFSDDEARVPSYRPVRPSSYQTKRIGGRQIANPISRSYRASSRRAATSLR